MKQILKLKNEKFIRMALAEESTNLKMGSFRLSSLRDRKRMMRNRLRHCQAQHSHTGIPGEEREAWRTSEEMWAENFPTLMKNTNLYIQEAQTQVEKLRHHSLTVQRQKENPKSIKREASHHIQGILHKIYNWFLTRNHGRQKAVEWQWCMHYAERKGISAKNAMSGKTIFQKIKKH